MSNIASSKENLYNNQIKQEVKLIIGNNYNIKAGSIIVVYQNGKETKYKNSGEPIVYSSHQELMIEIFDEIA